MMPKARLIKKNVPQADFVTKSWWVLCPIDIVCDSVFTNFSSESSSFNDLIHDLIHQLIYQSNIN